MILDEENKEVVDAEVVEEAPKNEEANPDIFEDYVMKMTEGEKEDTAPVEPNRRAFASMRIAAFLIDICLIFLATFGFKTLFDHTAISNDFKDNYYRMCYIADHLKLKEDIVPSCERYAVQIFDTDSRYNESAYASYTVYTVEGTDSHYKIVDMDKLDGGTPISNELKTAYNKLLADNSQYRAYLFNCKLIDYGLVMFAAGLSSLVFIFIVPLTNKRRATLGRLAAGIQLIHYRYEVEAKWYQILGRFLFIFAFEIALPQLFLSNALYTMLVVSPLILLTCLTNKDRRSINDLVSRTMSIDKRTFVALDEQ